MSRPQIAAIIVKSLRVKKAGWKVSRRKGPDGITRTKYTRWSTGHTARSLDHALQVEKQLRAIADTDIYP